MNDAPQKKIEEVSADEVEVISTGETKKKPKVRVISADEPYSGSYSEEAKDNPLDRVMGNIEEMKKIKLFGFLALILSLVGIVLKPFYLEPIAIVLALLDIWKGSKFTRKVDYAAIMIALLALLNAWQ